MSAMHWEARRRQAVVDRRLSIAKQMQKDPPKPHTEEQSQLNMSEAPPVTECVHCKNIRSSNDRGAKLGRRYTSIEYSQQW